MPAFTDTQVYMVHSTEQSCMSVLEGIGLQTVLSALLCWTVAVFELAGAAAPSLEGAVPTHFVTPGLCSSSLFHTLFELPHQACLCCLEGESQAQSPKETKDLETAPY